MGLLAVVGGAQRPALGAGEVAVHLREALLGALVVAQHRVVPGQLEELGDPPQLRLGVADQLLVLDLDVVQPGPVGARPLDLADPALGDVSIGGGSLRIRLKRDSAASRPSRIMWMNRASGIQFSICFIRFT